MKIFTFVLMLFVVPITACATSYTQNSATVQPAKNIQHTSKMQLENLYGLEVKDNILRLQIMSNGCTKAKSFKLVWQNDNLTAQRLKPDYCRRMPHKIWLEFEMPSQTKAFSVVNKFAR